MVVQVAVNGYGNIGKRVADAISKQDDMQLVGVSKTRPNFEAFIAVEKGYPLYASESDKLDAFKAAGLDVSGTTVDMLKEADVIVDATPEGMGAQNLERFYKPAGIKAIFEGGEKHDAIGASFNAYCNYEQNLGKEYVRVVSCNTTGLCRTLYAVNKVAGIKKVRAVLVRRAADPIQIKKGPINAIVPNPPTVPSHHGPDVNTIAPEWKILTMAVLASTTLMHEHNIMVEVEREVTKEDLLKEFYSLRRIMLVRASDGLGSTAELIELSRDLGRPRYDLWEIPIWEESVNVVGNEVFYMQGVHQEADIILENVDCIRAVMEIEKDPWKSIDKTDKSMGVRGSFRPPRVLGDDPTELRERHQKAWGVEKPP
ncbi:MAG TPA: type II glyceraldehyde-3-phosphate dehydrogenase [Candidatus Acidoferrales bacterium]|nr:type II glyceraldehyde-3-phosphate dehydrogenase [Candidatus Acidoferrales bacterium]